MKERERERERVRFGFVLAILGFCGIALEKSRFSVFQWGCVGEEQI